MTNNAGLHCVNSDGHQVELIANLLALHKFLLYEQPYLIGR